MKICPINAALITLAAMLLIIIHLSTTIEHTEKLPLMVETVTAALILCIFSHIVNRFNK